MTRRVVLIYCFFIQKLQENALSMQIHSSVGYFHVFFNFLDAVLID